MSDGICQYVARSDKQGCKNPSDTHWGFCIRHAKTAQSKKARLALDNEKKLREDERRKVIERQEYERYKNQRESLQPTKNRPSKPPSKKQARRIFRNNQGRLEDPSTRIIFNRCGDGRMKAIGQQDKDGNIIPLSEGQIEWCERSNMLYAQYKPRRAAEKHAVKKRGVEKREKKPLKLKENVTEDDDVVEDEEEYTEDDPTKSDEDDSDESSSSDDDGGESAVTLFDPEEDEFEYVYES